MYISEFENILKKMKTQGVYINGPDKKGEKVRELMTLLGIDVKDSDSESDNCVTIEASKFLNIIDYNLPPSEGRFSYKQYRPFNNYDSPVASEREFLFEKDRVKEDALLELDLNEDGQIDCWNSIKEYLPIFFENDGTGTGKYSYKYQNGYYDVFDGFVLSAMINSFKPNNIIEIGSGYSTMAMIDATKTNKLETDITCIEPFPGRLMSQLKEEDIPFINIEEKFVQELPLEKFKSLKKGDILFIDSSHVLKVGGDIAYELLHILPILNKGVIIHFHDIVYPFTYPDSWIEQGRPYNEAYILRALLMGNKNYRILFFNSMMKQLHLDIIAPDWKNYCDLPVFGGGIWIEKV